MFAPQWFHFGFILEPHFETVKKPPLIFNQQLRTHAARDECDVTKNQKPKTKN